MNKESSTQSSAREFTLILISAVMLSFAFVYWFKSTPISSDSISGGLDVGKDAPPVEADFWVLGDGPTEEQLEGEVYVVVAWATWCLPCYETAPKLVEVEQAFASQGVKFYGLTAAAFEEESKILAWLKDRNVTWPNGFGMKAIETLIAFDGESIPAMWVIGRDGKVWWNRGMSDQESLSEALDRTLKESQPSESEA